MRSCSCSTVLPLFILLFNLTVTECFPRTVGVVGVAGDGVGVLGAARVARAGDLPLHAAADRLAAEN